MAKEAQTKVAVRRIGHVVLKVRDLERTRKFYELLGLEYAAQIRNQMLFLRAGQDHHTIAFLRVGPNAPGPVSNGVGLFHVAFQVDSEDELHALYQRLKEAKVAFSGFTDHVVSHSIYFQDPDGNEIEVYADQPRERWADIEDSIDSLPWNPEA